MSEKAKQVALQTAEISAKTALSMIPVGGALITSVWDSIKSNCAQKRLDEWQNVIEERLSKVDESLENIGTNENFTSAMFQTTELAIKTAENKKRIYLANAVINSLTCPFEESIIMIFFDMIGKYSLWHIKILDYFQNPLKFEIAQKSKSTYMMGGPKTVLYDVYPELRDKDEYVNRIVKELYADGLMNTGGLDVIMTGDGMVASRVTDMGNEFIKYMAEDNCL
ncbi:hypothetical protein [Stomatobaculum longum]|uniref:hypothetical protein n=1 Tax=Stomatobaculum longum TaxID=796942 RepID=UPI0028EC6D59|nr:hypothetical protein [Stomatobaculum longum]